MLDRKIFEKQVKLQALIEPTQMEALRQKAKSKKISISQLVRELIDEHVVGKDS